MKVTHAIIVAALVFPATSTHASTFNYVCNDHGKSLPLKVDDTKNVLEWKGVTYKIKVTDCGRAGWHAESRKDAFDFCTATKGYADFQQGGITIQCDLKR